MIALRTPIKFIGITIFLIMKLKWAGVVAALVMLMTVPVYYLVGKKTGEIMKEVNNFKDERIKFYTKIIDGIKFIKIYGWEIAFTHIIQTLRN
jgi:ATP-binding cassette subfamily C (CFTR/MRP) protein 4